MLEYPAELPIVSYRDKFHELYDRHQVIIVSGETGSGKTTQLPKFCLENSASPQKKGLIIGCTQPRRVAATSVCGRVAAELQKDSHLVGYKIRFQDKTDKDTRIKFMTDGVLLAEIRQDPQLSRYETIIIDEAHERSLNIDFLLGYMKKLLSERSDLKLVVTSATIDTEIFASHFNNAPIMTVEGRSYPVEVRYTETQDNEKDEVSHVEQCAEKVMDLFKRNPPADTLIFLPTEKDIRECCALLEGQLPSCLVLPMFGRLQSADQKKIFAPSSKTKIVVATNVAETSITVPGIRYVIDSGLARISRYNVRARTTSLPIAKISKASADQRAGRCGRIGPGICVRLYSEEDYKDREQYTLPEIKRSNLADVILQMISMNLGSPFDFPFIEPPHSSAIRDGYSLLNELGALNNENKLNKVGRIMARLPIDPPISRILIAARDNNCVREMSVIAPALAIQDPRVRPADRENAADTAHKQFAHEHSDFLSLLKIWNLFHKVKEKGSSWGVLKKFCKTNYLSFQRMREWLDLHEQLVRILEREKGFSGNEKDASYAAIHQSLCSGFLRNIGQRKDIRDRKEKLKATKLYLGAGGKEFMIFPGSHQFHSGGKWIIGAAFLETNRLYALTVANIDERWLLETAKHLCRRSWSNPRWSKKSGQIIADEKVTLFGLVLSADRKVNFGRTSKANREEARNIFIRQALMENELAPLCQFLENNKKLISRWQNTEERLRKRDLLVDDNVLYHFYDKRLPNSVYDSFTLNRFIRDKKNHDFLTMREEDILNRRPEENELQDFPGTLQVGSRKLRLQYNLAPGEEDDGVTVRIPLDDLDSVNQVYFDWLVPGLLREKVTFLLKGLPKRIRKRLIPINQTVDQLLDDCIHYQGSLTSALEKGIMKNFSITVNRGDWPPDLPDHLCMRYLLYDGNGREVAAGRDLTMLRKNIHQPMAEKIKAPTKTTKNLQQWQDRLYTTWDFDDLPRRTVIFTDSSGKIDEVAGYLYPCLHVEQDKGGVSMTFDSDRRKAEEANRKGMFFLYRQHFNEEYKNLKRYCGTALSGPSSFWLLQFLGNRQQATESVLDFIMNSLFIIDLENIPDKATYLRQIEMMSKRGLYRVGRELCDTIMLVLRKRKKMADHISRFATLARNSKSYDKCQYLEYEKLAEEILPHNFLKIFVPADLENGCRYFQALMIRIERAHVDIRKDMAKAEQLLPYLNKLQKLPQDLALVDFDCQEAITSYKNMIKEYRVAIFAPEIAGSGAASAKKLKQQWQKVVSLCPYL